MAKASRQARGYDSLHVAHRKRLLFLHRDGALCWWCKKPMYREPERNPDGKPLAADHVEPGGASRREPASRLLHFTCNSARGDGSRDHLRPAVVGFRELGMKPGSGGAAFDWSGF
ncbi:hypothetical protein QPX56_06405 [Corynebacterium pseudodiphtheriticum]|uniref:hypothetical protein n=1 Tax=Corynebacterium pseudodiphtheriticum TaxID=37637 RepID=UPI00254334C8|nr:hypothetical protein [Corynebacterium pseudodiphtheriticum]MDK4328402.1 hypothetical protein [Corynebacterium pseudodiphtheriticum]